MRTFLYQGIEEEEKSKVSARMDHFLLHLFSTDDANSHAQSGMNFIADKEI